ncbi:MAG: cold shock domain-containing protein [Pirellulaceae bacterium]|nr:cold shock domain-containing protein [Pirellulaceae bacterium]
MFYGFIKHLSERGFGFIGQEGGLDVYFHASIMPPEQFANLRPDQPVMFEYAKRDPDEKPGEKRGPRAAKVQLIDKMPGGVLPPPPRQMLAQRHPKAIGRKATWKRRISVPALEKQSPPQPGNTKSGDTELGSAESSPAE